MNSTNRNRGDQPVISRISFNQFNTETDRAVREKEMFESEVLRRFMEPDEDKTVLTIFVRFCDHIIINWNIMINDDYSPCI